MNRFLLLFLTFVWVSASGQADLKKLDAYYAKALKDWGVPGMSIAIVKDGKVVFSKGYGTREAGKNETPDGNTLYAIASNSKAFTSAAIGTLVDAGKLAWNDPVIRYIPDFALPDGAFSDQVTIRDILSHRVGLGTFSGDLIWYRSELSDEDIIKRVKHLPTAYGFRAGYGYSNVMFITAGEILERVSGKSWGDYIGKTFLQPLGMSRTIVGTRQLEKMDNYAIPHSLMDGEHKPMPWEDWEHVAATGGIISSVNDMAKWMIFNLNHGIREGDTLVSVQAHNMIWTPHNNFVVDHTRKDATSHFSGYGLGWGLSDYHGHFRAGHTGGYAGMVSAVALIPQENLGVVILTNGMKPIYSALVNYTLDAFLKVTPRDWSKENLERYKKWVQSDTRIRDRENSRIANTKPSLPLKAYAGNYDAPAYGTITVSEEGGKLKMLFEHTPDLTATLSHWHYDTWKLEWDRPEVIAWFTFGTVKFETDNNGKVTGISFDVPNDDFWFEELNAKRQP